MKLIELLNKYNQELKTLSNCKFDDAIEFDELVINKLSTINTELKNLLKVECTEIRLIKKEDIKKCGSIGEKLFVLDRYIRQDKRVKHGYKGTIIKLEFVLSQDVNEKVLNMELKDLQSYFNKKEKLDTISFYKEEIEKYKTKIKVFESKIKELE